MNVWTNLPLKGPVEEMKRGKREESGGEEDKVGGQISHYWNTTKTTDLERSLISTWSDVFIYASIGSYDCLQFIYWFFTSSSFVLQL